MEKNEVFWGHNSLRTFFGGLNAFNSFFRKSNSSHFLPNFYELSFGFKSKKQKVKYQKFSTQAGFTLIEIIVVIGILSILAAVVLTILDPLEQYRKAQDTRRKTDLAQIQRGLESYYQDFHRYPQASSDNEIAPSGTTVSWGSSWTPYMDVLPIDPNTTKHYAYWVDSTGQSYALYASLDRGGRDPQACNGGSACQGTQGTGQGGANITCGNNNLLCTYGVSSPNISP